VARLHAVIHLTTLRGVAMRTDEDIKRDVENELKWDSDIDSSDIGVAVKDGAVTLSGFVRSYRQSRRAEEDATRVRGVKGVANDLEVRLPLINKRPDPDNLREIIAELKYELPYSMNTPASTRTRNRSVRMLRAMSGNSAQAPICTGPAFYCRRSGCGAASDCGASNATLSTGARRSTSSCRRNRRRLNLR
jgi:hypothetical protein